MNLSLYKPNPKNTGCAISFQIAPAKDNKEPQFFVNCLLQHSWNSEKKTGSFVENRKNPSKNIALKFNEFELGEFVHTFRTNKQYSTFHTTGDYQTQIRLTPYSKTRGKDKFAVEVMAFGLSFIRNGSDTFKIPIDPGEAIRLTSFIEYFFTILDDHRKLEQEKYFANQKPKTSKLKSSKEPEPDPSDDGQQENDEYDF
jgi:hypothetical protein